MSSITPKERAELCRAAYKGNFDPTKWEYLRETQNTNSGVKVYAVRKVGTDEVVFVARGTDSIYKLEEIPYGSPIIVGSQNIVPDGDVYAINSTASGQFNAQFKEAPDFVHEFKREMADAGKSYEYSVAGHSLGGAISQVIAHTFNLGGVTFDSLVGSKIAESSAYLQHVVQVLKIDPSTLVSDKETF